MQLQRRLELLEREVLLQRACQEHQEAGEAYAALFQHADVMHLVEIGQRLQADEATAEDRALIDACRPVCTDPEAAVLTLSSAMRKLLAGN